MIPPGRVEAFNLDLWGTCVQVNPGQRPRLSVFSAYSSLLARNLNTGGPIADETTPAVAEQTIHLDRAHPSAVVLPIID